MGKERKGKEAVTCMVHRRPPPFDQDSCKKSDGSRDDVTIETEQYSGSKRLRVMAWDGDRKNEQFKKKTVDLRKHLSPGC